MITEEMYREWLEMRFFPEQFNLPELNALYRHCYRELDRNTNVHTFFHELLDKVFTRPVSDDMYVSLMDGLTQFVLLNRLHETWFDMKDIQSILVIHVFVLIQLEVMYRVWERFEECAGTRRWVREKVLVKGKNPFVGRMGEKTVGLYDSALNKLMLDMYDGYDSFYTFLKRVGWLEGVPMAERARDKKSCFQFVFMHFAFKGEMANEWTTNVKGMLLNRFFEVWYPRCVQETRLSMFNCELWHRVLVYSGTTMRPYCLTNYETVFQYIIRLINVEIDERGEEVENSTYMASMLEVTV